MNARIVGQPDLSNVAIIDHNVVPFIRACQNNGISIDREHFHELSEYLDYEIAESNKKITSYVPQEALDAFTEESLSLDDFNPDSPAQVGTLLFKHLNIGADKELTTTKSGTRLSTGKKQLERLKQDHPIIPLILQRREYKKLQTTYATVLPNLAQYIPSSDEWRVFYKIGLTFTSTGRMVCSRLHQIPIRTDLGRLIRQGFVTRPGHAFVSIDFSQIELRVLANNAQERRMMEIFSDPEGDIHYTTQQGIGMPDTLDKIQKRLAAKRTNFGIVFSITDLGLYLALQADGIPCTQEMCAGFIADWYKTYPDVAPYVQQQHYRARRYGMVWTLFGRVSPVPEVRSVHRRIVSEGLRRAQNFGIQGCAADIFKIAAAQVYEFCQEVKLGLFGAPKYLEPILPIHDQILLESSSDIAEEVAEAIGYIMSNAVELRVPIMTDYNIAERWEK
jgi:DNA polymerase I